MFQRQSRQNLGITLWLIIVQGCLSAVSSTVARGADPFPTAVREVFTNRCSSCHGADNQENLIEIDPALFDVSSDESRTHWRRVYDVIAQHEMPPAKAAQPSPDEREQVLKWLRVRMSEPTPTDGTLLRRLNREEYENTIRSLFDMPDFRVPESFPTDDSMHGFDNLGESLVLSPPLLAQYLALATQVADEILPPDRGPAVAKPRRYDIGATGLAESSLTSIEGDRFRIASSRDNANTAGWPKRFAAPVSGVYRLTFRAARFESDKMKSWSRQAPFRLSVHAKLKTAQTYDPYEKLRKLVEFQIQPARHEPESFSCEVELFAGEEFGIRWENGPNRGNVSLRKRLDQDRRLHAAMLALKGDPRGMSQVPYYEQITALLSSESYDLGDPRLDEELKNLPFGGVGHPDGPELKVSWILHEESRRFGPALDITDVAIEGPLRLVEDEQMRAKKRRTENFLGRRPSNASDRQHAETVLNRFLPRAFRRPVSESLRKRYVDLAMSEVGSSGSGRRVEDGLHVAVRRALVSPHFLYRGQRPGRLDDFDLASRLSYFLTSSPPDHTLIELASRGELSEPDVLERETLRLLQSPDGEHFVRSFTGQWLGTRALHDIMPDPRLFFYYEGHRRAMTDEAEMFFAEILRENHPIRTFIDPGFSYRNKLLNGIYGDEWDSNEMRRVEIERGGRHGGILGLAAVMMATANGVDTHPVHRGVWLLENVFGTPTPPPPSNVPSIAADTSGTTTMRSQLQAHREDASCNRCHVKIDPLGMVMENFDPVGRWREHYPVFVQPADGEETLKKQFYDNTGKGTIAGPKIDSAGELPDGTRLHDVRDLKRYLVDHIDRFSTCLTRKLLTYGTGRVLSFSDEREVERIVKTVQQKGNGFRDLIVVLVQSDAFSTK